jgi:hypothetical protein
MPTGARDDGLQHISPAIGAVHIAGHSMQRSRSPNWLNRNGGDSRCSALVMLAAWPVDAEARLRCPVATIQSEVTHVRDGDTIEVA